MDQILWNSVDLHSSGIAKNQGVVTVTKIAVGDDVPHHSLLTRKVHLETVRCWLVWGLQAIIQTEH